MKISPAQPTTSKNTFGTKLSPSSTRETITSVSGMAPAKNGGFSANSLTRAGRKRKIQQRRYYFIRKLREMGYQIETERRSIQTPYTTVNEIPLPDRYYVRQLLKLGFQQELTFF
ncbi:hypothetical protein [Cyclobacterium sp.]|uniref:hypothetical protein n=1 Tax=Cyclobacterium sp. TaxID=1966343 RepID=UPI0019B0B41A|nr:hypothetical protein [Cyclobacterium sp.]MBD3630490.1 hypothetical protein [Cyclobacterium sp.]